MKVKEIIFYYRQNILFTLNAHFKDICYGSLDKCSGLWVFWRSHPGNQDGVTRNIEFDSSTKFSIPKLLSIGFTLNSMSLQPGSYIFESH